jgi:hypothetical protein
LEAGRIRCSGCSVTVESQRVRSGQNTAGAGRRISSLPSRRRA